MLDFNVFCAFLILFRGLCVMAKGKVKIEENGKTTRVVGYVQKEKLDVWTSVKKELEKRNSQKLNDSFILNYILGSIQQDGKLVIF
jgi:hypothetical protein